MKTIILKTVGRFAGFAGLFLFALMFASFTAHTVEAQHRAISKSSTKKAAKANKKRVGKKDKKAKPAPEDNAQPVQYGDVTVMPMRFYGESLSLERLAKMKQSEPEEDEAQPREIMPKEFLLDPGTDLSRQVSPLAAGDSVQILAPEALGAARGVHFEGLGSGFPGYSVQNAPPDTTLAVGPNHIVQWVNVKYAVFNKSGTPLVGPVNGNALFAGMGNQCETTNNGDPILQYDRRADRWILSQFAVSAQPYLQCIAVSTTNDPTGTYYRYSVNFGNRFNDYGKLGVWTDAYYTSYNNFVSGSFQDGGLCASDRTKMLAGDPAATTQCFYGTYAGSGGSLLPADLDGTQLPTDTTQGGIFMRFSTSTGALRFLKLKPDFATPANSTLTDGFGGATGSFVELSAGSPALPCGGGRGTCIPQPETTTNLDTLGDRLMYRLVYRNVDGVDRLLVTRSLDPDGSGGQNAAVAWYEVRNPFGNPTDATPANRPNLFQSSIYNPDQTNDRWMGSLAMDKFGNMLMGYSVANAATGLKPSIAVAGRRSGDVLNTMRAETIDTIGTGSQTIRSNGAALTRWGDYSTMQIDPADDETFWYTTEYLAADGTFNWRTRVTSYKFSATGSAVIVNNGINIISESNLPANNTPDPGETVTVSLALQNIGDANSGNTSATLQNSGGITPAAPTTQSYGAIAIGGVVTRNFTFNVPANAVCGGSVTLTFQVQDGAISYTFTKIYILGTRLITNSENFDSVTAPVLPANWTSTLSGSGTGWTTSTTTPASAPNAAFAGNPATVGLSELESPVWNVNSATARLDFKINYNTEATYDGAVLEIKIGAGAYQDIIAAGGSFAAGGYNATLDTLYNNPLAGRSAWSGNSNGYVSSSVNLPAAANGQTVQFRWRMGSDSSVGGVGVRLDDVQLFGAFACAVVLPRSLIVTKTADTNDGICDGDCSLREALDVADGDNLTDRITFDIPANSTGCNGTNCTITLSSPLAPLADGGLLTLIDGAAGANSITLSGNGATRILTVGSGVNLAFDNLNFTRGNGGCTASGCASTNGGAIFNAGTLALTNSALYNNSTSSGGAIYNQTGGALTLTNVTISGNTAAGGIGGGIFGGASVTATNCTITGNTGQFTGGVSLANASSSFTVRNTIIAGNTSSFSPDAQGNFTSQGYNLVGNLSGATGFTQTGDQTGTTAAPLSARLAPLGNYGGKTFTHALLDGGSPASPAINAGTASGAPLTDQRGANRVGAVDIGAFEVSNAANGGTFVALLPDGGAGYNQTIAPESGAFTYTLAAGMLPNGFSLLTGAARFAGEGKNQTPADFAPSAGRVSIQGTPTISRNFPFTIALNNGTNSTTMNYSIFVPVGPTAASVAVAGRVQDGTGRGVANAVVSLTAQNGNSRTARTNAFGNYRFDEVESGQTYIVSVQSKRYQFTPQVISVSEEIGELNFYANQ